MLTVRVGKIKMKSRRQNFKGKVLRFVLVLVVTVVFLTLILQKYSDPLIADLRRNFPEASEASSQRGKQPKLSVCDSVRSCPRGQFSFFVRSGAANVVAPKICVQNKLVLGAALNNAGPGINIVILNGNTGEVMKADHFNMYSGDVSPLLQMLGGVALGSAVLMASYDDPSTKLNEDARKLIAEFGSSAVHSLKFRDSWVFVGGKGAEVKSAFEKHLKNDNSKNKYEKWPELIELDGCIPKYLE